ncbi:hypothetical protein D9M71_819880 [compost metagenome]
MRGVRVRRGDVLLCDFIRRERNHAARTRRLVLDADLGLLAFGRLEGLVFEAGAVDRLERGGIAGIGRQAVLEQIDRAGAPRGGFVVIARLGARGAHQ